jgi:hypothetical protein
MSVKKQRGQAAENTLKKPWQEFQSQIGVRANPWQLKKLPTFLVM